MPSDRLPGLRRMVVWTLRKRAWNKSGLNDGAIFLSR
jgi:hypothetical protein